MPWAREGSRFTLLSEQAAITLVREMLVLAAARVIGVKRHATLADGLILRAQALSKMDLGEIKAVALDGTASKRGYTYIIVFIDLDRKQKPAIFVTLGKGKGKGKGYLVLFSRFLRRHGGDHNNIAEVVCDMSSAFLAAIGESFPSANVTVDWFHVV
ncbi:hypothetical protein DFAR_4040011 [Desulfarculales bacterium]